MHLFNLVNSVFSVLISMYKHCSEGQIIYKNGILALLYTCMSLMLNIYIFSIMIL